MSVRILSPLLAAVALSALGGCALVQEKTLGESFDEGAADARIKTRMATSGGIGHFGEVDVAVEGRFVLLTGRVPSEADKIEAEKIAWSISSIDEVANELVVEERKVSADFNDLWIDQQVRARLVANNQTKSQNFRVRVYRGQVYLMGIARSDEELRAAAETAARVGGVKKVVSYVKVRGRASQPTYQTAPPPVAEPLAGGPPDQAPAPIVAAEPSRPPAVRPTYADPYAPGAAPPPGARSSNSGISSTPLDPVN